MSATMQSRDSFFRDSQLWMIPNHSSLIAAKSSKPVISGDKVLNVVVSANCNEWSDGEIDSEIDSDLACSYSSDPRIDLTAQTA